MSTKLQTMWHDFYEKHKLYRLNPCDFGAWLPLRLLGRALARFSVECPCCSAVRILVFGALVHWLGKDAWWFALGAIVVAYLAEIVEHLQGRGE